MRKLRTYPVSPQSVGIFFVLAIVVTQSLFVVQAYSDCPKTTTKDIKCPGVTDQTCGGVVEREIDIPVNIPWLPPEIVELDGLTIPWCENIIWNQAQTEAFGTKSNAPNETQTQVDTDEADKVSCRKYGYCILDPTDPSKCIQKSSGVQLANPQEEIECEE